MPQVLANVTYQEIAKDKFPSLKQPSNQPDIIPGCENDSFLVEMNPFINLQEIISNAKEIPLPDLQINPSNLRGIAPFDMQFHVDRLLITQLLHFLISGEFPPLLG